MSVFGTKRICWGHRSMFALRGNPDIDVLRAAYLLPLPRSAKTRKAAEVSRQLSRLLLDRPKPALLYFTTMSVIDPKERETGQ